MSTATRTGQYVELSKTATVITYLDEDQSLNVASADWTPTWLIGSGAILDPGEQVEISLNLSGLIPLLGTNKEFSIQVKPEKGAVLVIKDHPGGAEGRLAPAVALVCSSNSGE